MPVPMMKSRTSWVSTLVSIESFVRSPSSASKVQVTTAPPASGARVRENGGLGAAAVEPLEGEGAAGPPRLGRRAFEDLRVDELLVGGDLDVLAVERDFVPAVGDHHVAPPAADAQVDLAHG